MEAVCDKNCFACIHPDCICDSLEMDDIRESDARDREVKPKGKYTRRAESVNKGNRSEYWKLYYQENKEKINARRRERRKENPESEKAAKRRYYEKHREKCIEQAKAWNQANKEKAKASRKKYYEKNKERLNKQKAAREKIRKAQKRSETP